MSATCGVHFKPAFGPLALQAIHRDTIQGYLASKLAAGTKPKSVKNHFVILKEMLKYAVEWHCLVTNPAAGVKAPRVEREEMDRLTPAEVHHLLMGVPKRRRRRVHRLQDSRRRSPGPGSGRSAGMTFSTRTPACNSFGLRARATTRADSATVLQPEPPGTRWKTG